MKGREYHYEAVSQAAFIQQLATLYVQRGYWFYVTGIIPEGKVKARVDAKLIGRYSIAISKWARYRRKLAGLGNAQYLRHGSFFVIMATKGAHKVWLEEPLTDCRREPLHAFGYSISYRQGRDGRWHVAVRISVEEFKRLKAYLLGIACQRSVEELAAEFQGIPFEPYAAIRRQLLELRHWVNQARAKQSLEPVPIRAIRLHRKSVKVFEAELIEQEAA